ncbi:transcription factor bHLH111 isoform X2 [Daucus carota subsp. sativus]|uniref:transcription factor bHLH111 isoform X2 n=1 Tax=Daucus carota subsp. sativus TaxID=79200 RepID=UPI0007EFB44E|nr:PREDICTED: transcription factor bHLH111 isoform X2 [Daucus carota subsp. sativus]
MLKEKKLNMIPFNTISSIRAAMAEECNESSVATSPSIPNWWPADNHLHAGSLGSWSGNTGNINPWSGGNNSQNPNSNNSRSSGEEDVSMSTSFTNASNHSGLTVESSRRLVESVANNELMGETPDNPLWNHVFLNVGNNGELHNNQDTSNNLINAFSSKNLSTGLMFEPCDYLKKMDNGWDGSTPFNNFDQKNFNGSFSDNMFEAERLTKLSNLVSNWSIAPPDPEINGSGDVCYMKQNVNRDLSSYPSHGDDHDLKVELNDQRDNHTDQVNVNNLFPRAYDNGTRMGYQTGINNSMGGDNSKLYYGVHDVSCNNGRNLEDVMAFSSGFGNKLPPTNIINPSKPLLKTLNLSDCKKQTQQPSYTPTSNNTLARTNRKGHMLANEGKKKRSEGKLDAISKKLKHDNSTASSIKVQVPKAKLGDKITALQQIVSPFGKTDTASVLWEAIGYIKFLQEQVQLLSNPYMKTTNNIKDPWGGLDRKDRGDDVKLDLSSRGLCLIPVSCTPQMYRENTGPDYLTPAYRGCLYR